MNIVLLLLQHYKQYYALPSEGTGLRTTGETELFITPKHLAIGTNI